MTGNRCKGDLNATKHNVQYAAIITALGIGSQNKERYKRNNGPSAS